MDHLNNAQRDSNEKKKTNTETVFWEKGINFFNQQENVEDW